MTTNPVTDPEHIAISKSRGIEIDWRDGHHSSYGLEYLRDWCPCATCTGAHGTAPRRKTSSGSGSGSGKTDGGLFPMYKPREKMVNIEPAGNYALKIVWSDGHASGIYSYDHLRTICPCKVCAAVRGAAS
jgi:DUF971 family protein